MITTRCMCGAALENPETHANSLIRCQGCGEPIRFVAAEALPEGSGAGDFDSRLTIIDGPHAAGHQLYLGGVPEIEIGKLSEKHIHLPGSRVSRAHCKLQRLDFGPSRWKIVDNRSTNGLFINGKRVEEAELRDGDQIKIGEFELQYAAISEAPASIQSPTANGPVCPSCGKPLAAKAKICVGCGIDVKTGRPLVTSKGIDENDLAVRADTWIRLVSWIMPFGLFPIASEAFGTRKPMASWVIAGITILASIAFCIAMQSDEPSAATLNMMHWTGSEEVTAARMEQLADRLKSRTRDPDALKEIIAAFHPDYPPGVEFHWYQLFTHALIHDPSLITPFLFHLGGNMLFFFVFGLRVNELIGSLKMAILYPLLTLGSAGIDHWAHLNSPLTPGLGASGVIMGLAGMYFVFFPVQKVHMAVWLRLGILTRWQCFYKLWMMRGFWLLVLWVGFNDLLPMFLGSHDHVDHWAHLGGFICGMTAALVLLISRLVNGRGSDLLSVALGKRAWALIGKPSDWQGQVAIG